MLFQVHWDISEEIEQVEIHTFLYIVGLCLFSVGYNAKSINNKMHLLIYNHICQSSKNCSFQIPVLITVTNSLNDIEINVECIVSIFGNFFQ